MNPTRTPWLLAKDVNVRDLTPLFLTSWIGADYQQDGKTLYGRVTQVRRRQGVLQGKLIVSGKWVTLSGLYLI